MTSEELSSQIEVLERGVQALAARILAPVEEFAKDEGFVPAPYHADADETVKCPDCGKMNDDDAKFCDQCSHELAGEKDVEVK